MSRLSDVSWASVSSGLLSPQAATTKASDRAAVNRGIYCNIKPPPRVTIGREFQSQSISDGNPHAIYEELTARRAVLQTVSDIADRRAWNCGPVVRNRERHSLALETRHRRHRQQCPSLDDLAGRRPDSPCGTSRRGSAVLDARADERRESQDRVRPAE